MIEKHVTLKRGTIVASKYRVMDFVGQGSMGAVYRCCHVKDTLQEIALKVICKSHLKDPQLYARLKNEVRVTYEISHPHVVRGFDFIKEQNFVGFATEYLAGGDLAVRIEESRSLSFTEIVRLLVEIAMGLQAIHECGIIHRDLKPSNILLSKDGHAKISDFGIAVREHWSGTGDGEPLLGTVNYMSPEYILDGWIDARSDIFAFGLIAYELITGIHTIDPDESGNVVDLLQRRATEPVRPPSELRPQCPAELDRIVLRACHLKPSQRYHDISEALRDLFQLFSSEEPAYRFKSRTPQSDEGRALVLHSSNRLE